MGSIEKISLLVLIGASAWSCGGSTTETPSSNPPPVNPPPVNPPPVNPPPGENPAVIEARAKLKTTLDLHTQVIARSCSPSGGVCHNDKEYPDLHTAGNMIIALNLPCNLARAGEPKTIFDGCEPAADEIRVGDWRTRIGKIQQDQTNPSTWLVETEGPAPRGISDEPAQILRSGNAFFVEPLTVHFYEGEKQGLILNVYNLKQETQVKLFEVKGGDPNGNGTFGASDPWRLIYPGRMDRSYLFGRITATVPGSRMPLANQRLSEAEYVAIACWIESMGHAASPTAEDAIDYDACAFAKAPRDYTF